MLASSQRENIGRLVNGEGLLRIGHIWYGENDVSTATSIYYFGNKKIQTVIPIRTESALSFSSGTPPIDTLQVEIVVKYRGFRDYIQSLFAQLQITRVLPVINPTIASIVAPVQLNKDLYAAHGYHDIVNDTSIINSSSASARSKLFKMYCSVPIQMRIDQAMLSSIKGAPGSFRLLITLTRALSSNIYGDKVYYIENMDGSIEQEKYMKKYAEYGGDNERIKTVARMIGVPVSKYERIIESLKSALNGNYSNTESVSYKITDVLSMSMYLAEDFKGNKVYLSPYGVEGLITLGTSEMFGIPFESCYPKSVDVIKQTADDVRKLSDIFRNEGTVTVRKIETAGISYLDGIRNRNERPQIIYGIIITPSYGDVANYLIKEGYALQSPSYDEGKVPDDYKKARIEVAGVDATTERRAKGTGIYRWLKTNTINYPWITRKEARHSDITE